MAANEVERQERAHRNTYGLFTGLIKWGAIISFVATMLVILVISN